MKKKIEENMVLLGAVVSSAKAEMFKKKLAEKNITSTMVFEGCIDSLISGEIEKGRGGVMTEKMTQCARIAE